MYWVIGMKMGFLIICCLKSWIYPVLFLERCSNLSRSIVVDNRNLLERFPELRTSGSNDMVITKSTGLVATYFDFSSTAWEDMVAYYTYKEGESVDIATIKRPS